METGNGTYFISGATGFIGSRLALRLAEQGSKVHALVRSRQKAVSILHPNITLHYGDILDPTTVRTAMEGCDHAFHLAAFAKPWSRDPELPYRLNVEATGSLLRIAGEQGVKSFIFTSSAATMEPSGDGPPTDENTPSKTTFFNQYDQTKALAEEVVREANNEKLRTVIVNPTRVYGPGPLSVSNGITRIMIRYRQGRWRIIPGNGRVIGNYAFVEDVVDGHLAACRHGKGGERYILGGEDLSFDDLFEVIGRVNGKRYRLFHLPMPVMIVSAWFLFNGARILGAVPPITPSWARKYMHHSRYSSKKAMGELGYRFISFEEGAERTIQWIRKTRLS